METLGLSVAAAHAEADRLEHALSEDVEARIDEALGFPESDPHGDPIPDADLRIRAKPWQPLSGMREEKAGRSVVSPTLTRRCSGISPTST